MRGRPAQTAIVCSLGMCHDSCRRARALLGIGAARQAAQAGGGVLGELRGLGGSSTQSSPRWCASRAMTECARSRRPRWLMRGQPRGLGERSRLHVAGLAKRLSVAVRHGASSQQPAASMGAACAAADRPATRPPIRLACRPGRVWGTARVRKLNAHARSRQQHHAPLTTRAHTAVPPASTLPGPHVLAPSASPRLLCMTS